MPKFKTIEITRANKTGEKRSEQFDIHVDAYGEFYTAPPEDVLNAAISMPLVCGATVHSPRRNARERIACSTFEGLVQNLVAAMDETMAVDITTERVIVYTHQAQLSLWQDADGSLHANGCIGNDSHENGGRWNDAGAGISATNKPGHFSIGLAAWVFDKVTYQRPNAQRLEFNIPAWEHSHLDYSTWGAKLNGFLLARPLYPESFSCMPYTEDAAEFFYRSIIGMADVGISLHEFFGDKSNIHDAIAQGAGPLLALG